MGIDAVVVVKLKRGARMRLNACLKRAQGAAVTHWLGPSAAVVSTGVRYGEPIPEELREALVHGFGEELFKLHADARGLFAAPDVAGEAALGAEDYDDAMELLNGAGVWLPLEPGGKAEVSRARSFDELLSEVWVDDEDEKVCLLLGPGACLDEADIEAHDVYELSDGARVVHTVTDGPDAFKAMRQELQREVLLRKTHADPHGVLAFRDGLLDDVRERATYQAAVALVGKRGRWLCRSESRRRRSGRT